VSEPVEDLDSGSGATCRGAMLDVATDHVVVGGQAGSQAASGSPRPSSASTAGQSQTEAVVVGSAVGLVLGGLVVLLARLACRDNRLGDRLRAGAAVQLAVDDRRRPRRGCAGPDRGRASAGVGRRRAGVGRCPASLGDLLAASWLDLERPPIYDNDLISPRRLEVAEATERLIDDVQRRLAAVDAWLGDDTAENSCDGHVPHELPTGTAGTTAALDPFVVSASGIAQDHGNGPQRPRSNPRYTGRQVWGRRQQAGRRSGGRSHQSMSAGEWAVSVRPAHPALVSEAEFVAAQHVRAARQTGDGRARSYLLSGLVRCGVCGRRMDSHWVHGRAGYRCRHGHSSSRPRAVDGPRYVYVREDLLVSELVGRLADRPAVPDMNQVRRSDVASTLATLRAEGLLVVHDGRSWDLTTRQ
jgi:Recombinase zinc beta ribbon domain/Recombinase